MTRTISAEAALAWRMRSQRLAGGVRGGVADVVAGVVGLQAQDWPAALLGVRARSIRLRARDVDAAREEEMTVVRTSCMRGTLHLVASRDLRWLLALLGPVFIRASASRYRQLGLDEKTCLKAVSVISTAVERRGELTRAEIAQE
ncbi:MAG: DNA glycosylase AlkZ-like family protein, partial [Candidatus Geothermincolia bacterium]